MGNFRYRMLQFMIGRNGFDAFSRDLLFWAMILIFADIIIPGRIVRTIGIILMMYSYFEHFQEIQRKEVPKIYGIYLMYGHLFVPI